MITLSTDITSAAGKYTTTQATPLSFYNVQGFFPVPVILVPADLAFFLRPSQRQ